jgi:murein DD-endopeptidase MepM/ murein hydrolase activator NlpD
MKRNLIEQLERIHRLNYGNNVINENDLWDKIIGLTGVKRNVVDNKKADVVSDDVSVLYKNLEDAAKGNGITQQERGSMNFQKEVESMQIGLILLGYELPKHGVDGLFGPETGEAVSKFITQELGGDKKSVNESVKLVSQGGGLIGKPGQGTHSVSDWQSGNAWDVTGPVGAEVYSITSGTVNKVKAASGGLVKSGVKKIYGDQVSVKSNDGKPDVFYTHIDSSVSQGDSVKEGDVIGKIIQIQGIPSHVHVGISSGNLSDLASGLSNATGGKSGGFSGKTPTVATPEMLNKLIELLKEKGIKSEDITPYINKSNSGGGGSVTINDWEGVVNLIIDKLEGGYYHPDMLLDGRVKDGRFGNSGETMYGLDRKAGNIEATGAAGREFWSLIDAENARSKWKHNYMLKDNPTLDKQLRRLTAEIMKPLFIRNSKAYLSPESAEIISKDAALTFNFGYATWNGPGWFQRFAKVMNDEVASGNKDPKSLLQAVLSRRTESKNSLISQGGSKVANIANRISSTSTIA